MKSTITMRMLNAALAGAGLVAAVAATVHAASDPADVLKCKRTIAKQSGKFVQAKAKLLSKCEGSVLAGKLPGTTVCHTETKTGPAIAKATSKIRAGIGKACCGDDKTCGNADDILLGEIGITDPNCPDAEGGNAPASSCASIIMHDPGQVADCVACVNEEEVDEAISLYYDQLVTTDPATQKDLNKCQQAIGKSASAFLIAKSKALAKCWDGVLNGKITGPCPDGLIAAAAIQKAEDKKVASICKACGGDDKICSAGGDDQTVAEIGFVAECPPLRAGDPGTGDDVATLDDIVTCVDDVSSKRVDCTDAMGVPSLAAMPANCQREAEACTPDATSTNVKVTFALLAGVNNLTGISVDLSYNETKITLPGSGGADPLTEARITNHQPGTTAVSNDDGDSLIESITGVDPFTGTDLFTVEFDHCTGTVAAADFACTVRDASDDNFQTVTGVTCTPTILP